MNIAVHRTHDNKKEYLLKANAGKHIIGQELIDTALKLTSDNKGLLAIDESNATCNNRFAQLGIPKTLETRRFL